MPNYSTGFYWIYVLILLVVSGISYIIFNYAFTTQLFPALTTSMNSTVTNQTLLNTAYTNINYAIYIIKAIPLVLIGILTVSVVINSLSVKNRVE